jgi:D-glycero-D-manno-heptose 1,7-bisphosphate phosphatase
VSERRAVFIDRDGVINELTPDPSSGRLESPLRVEDVILVDGAGAALGRLAAEGLLLVGVSNQPAVAKGTISQARLAAVHSRVIDLLAAEGVHFDAFRLCLHHPKAIVSALKADCQCRKPAPGMLIDAADELGIELSGSWMIGDTDSDVQAGLAAGCRTVLIEHPGSAHKRDGAAQPDATVTDLSAAAALILSPDRVE